MGLRDAGAAVPAAVPSSSPRYSGPDAEQAGVPARHQVDRPHPVAAVAVEVDAGGEVPRGPRDLRAVERAQVGLGAQERVRLAHLRLREVARLDVVRVVGRYPQPVRAVRGAELDALLPLDAVARRDVRADDRVRIDIDVRAPVEQARVPRDARGVCDDDDVAAVEVGEVHLVRS